MRGIMNALVTGIVSVVGYIVVFTMCQANILTGTDAVTTMIRTMYPLVFGFLGIIAMIMGVVSLVKGGTGSMEG